MKILLSAITLFISLCSFGQSNKNTVRLPIEIWNDEILLKIKVNEIEGAFIWDNGFTITGIDSLFAQRCNILLPQKNSMFIDGNNQKVGLKKGVCKKIELGNFVQKNTPIILLNTKSFIQTNSKIIDGLIGTSIINNYNWYFNFDSSFVEISKKSFSNKGIELPFVINKNNNNHLMNININGYEALCGIDFGFNSDVLAINIMGAAYFQNHKAAEAYGINSFSVSGASSMDTSYIIKDNYSLKIANHTFDFLPVVSLSPSSHNINLGNKFFRNRYNVIIDCKQKKYILSERLKPETPNSKKSYGLRILISNNKFFIGKLTLNPNVKDKNIKLLQEVENINGKTPNDLIDNYFLLKYQTDILNKNEIMKIKMADGNVYELKPEFDEER